MNYTLQQLFIFTKIVEHESISQAAFEIDLTQPAVSIQLKKFQSQFDISLTELVGRKLHITDFGREIYTVCKRILKEAEYIQHTANQFKGLLSGKLKIAVVSTGKYVLPFFLSDFIKRYPNIKFRIDVTNKEKALKSLENNEVDFAFVSVLPDHLFINSYPIIENHLYLVGEYDEAKQGKSYTHTDLEQLPMIFREKGSATRSTMERFFIDNNIQHTNKLELVSTEAVKQAVCAGLGYSIMPLIGITDEIRLKKLQVYNVNKLPIKTHWNLIHIRDKPLSPVAKACIEHINENRNRIIKKYFNDFRELEKKYSFA